MLRPAAGLSAAGGSTIRDQLNAQRVGERGEDAVGDSSSVVCQLGVTSRITPGGSGKRTSRPFMTQLATRSATCEQHVDDVGSVEGSRRSIAANFTERWRMRSFDRAAATACKVVRSGTQRLRRLTHLRRRSPARFASVHQFVGVLASSAHNRLGGQPVLGGTQRHHVDAGTPGRVSGPAARSHDRVGDARRQVVGAQAPFAADVSALTSSR